MGDQNQTLMYIPFLVTMIGIHGSNLEKYLYNAEVYGFHCSLVTVTLDYPGLHMLY